MVRQYIGARYTPRFIGTYDATQAYEALDVVDNGTGTTYIARVPVPPNTPLTNTDYWLVYGSSSGAILDLQSRMTTAESDITAIKGSILSIGGQVLTNTSDISSLQAADVIQNHDISILKNKVKNMILIGDSWASGYGANYGWMHYLKQMLNYDNCYENSYGGSGFSATGTNVTNKSFLDMLVELQNTVADHNSIDTIIVAGGVNDSGKANVEQNGRLFIDYCKNTYPNAQVYVLIINRLIFGSLVRYDYVKSYSNLEGYLDRTHVFDLHKCAPLGSYDAGGLHLGTNAGYEYVAKAMRAALFGNKLGKGTSSKNVAFTNSELGITENAVFYEDSDSNIQLTLPLLGSNASFSRSGLIHTVTLAPPADVHYPYNENIQVYGMITLVSTTLGGQRVTPCRITINANGINIGWISGITETYSSIQMGQTVINYGSCW